jgi:TadE-like protein
MSSPRRRSSRGPKVRRSRGQSLVEFALILPVFLLVLAGILDFGMMLYSRLTLVNATREGARWAVVQPDVTTIPLTTGTSLRNASGLIGSNMSGLSWNAMVTAPGGITSSIAISCLPTAGGANCDFVAGGNPNAIKGDSILISTTYPYKSFFASLFGTTINIGTQVQMVLEVPTP